VLELARNNPGWGYTKIRDALRALKIEIGRTTVANVLAEAEVEAAAARRRKRTWKQFSGPTEKRSRLRLLRCRDAPCAHLDEDRLVPPPEP
jgi:hypothetical protein